MQTTPRVELRLARRRALRRYRGVLVGVAVVFASAGATAQHATAKEPSGAADGDFSAATQRHAAHLVLIGGAGNDPELATLLGELLARQRIDATLSRAERFDPDELFSESASGTLRVFVALENAHEARLYFRAPRDDRYLVRRLALPSGLDAVGRELVGQVVASLTAALLDATEGMTREQASAAVAGESSQPPVPSATEPAGSASPHAPQNGAPRFALQVHAAARYGAQWLGSDFGLRHGPALTAGLRWVGARVLFGGELGAEYGFEQAFSNPDVAIERQEHQFAGLAEAGVRLGRPSQVTLAVGPRLERAEVRLTPKTSAVTVEAPHTEVHVGMRAELRYEWAVGHLRLGACALADLAFSRTHYDLRNAGGTATELASVSVLRPGAAVWIGAR